MESNYQLILGVLLVRRNSGLGFKGQTVDQSTSEGFADSRSSDLLFLQVIDKLSSIPL